jgi:hypothetical protein
MDNKPVDKLLGKRTTKQPDKNESINPKDSVRDPQSKRIMTKEEILRIQKLYLKPENSKYRDKMNTSLTTRSSSTDKRRVSCKKLDRPVTNDHIPSFKKESAHEENELSDQ